MKKRTVICSLLVIAAQLYSVSGHAYMRVTQSGTNDAVSIIADGYSPYETLPVMLLKPGKGLADLENATKDIPTENLSDVVGYMSSLSADKDGNISGEIDLSAFSSGNTYGVVVNGNMCSEIERRDFEVCFKRGQKRGYKRDARGGECE